MLTKVMLRPPQEISLDVEKGVAGGGFSSIAKWWIIHAACMQDYTAVDRPQKPSVLAL